jgi:drug/metabolite transporter (DMT)-like permease
MIISRFLDPSGNGNVSAATRSSVLKSFETIMHSDYLKGIGYCLVAALSWGAMFQVMAGALARIDPFSFTSLRYLVAGAIFALILIAREGWQSLRIGQERLWPAWIFGTAGFAGFNFLMFLGQQMEGASGALVGSIMAALMPVVSLLLSWAVHRVRPSAASFTFILLSLFGVMLVVTDGRLESLLARSTNLYADALMFVGVCCFVIYTFGAIAYPKWSSLKYTTISVGLSLTSMCAINVVLFALKIVPIPSPATIAFVAPHLAYMAFVAAGIGVLSWNLGNKLLTPLNGVLFINVVPITAFAISALVGHPPSLMQVLGAVLTCIALIGNNLCARRTVQFNARPSSLRPSSRAT